jgi:hypothetical protein
MDLDTLDQETYLAEMKTLFRTPGWEIFIAEIWDNVNRIDKVENVSSADDLFYRKGQLAALGLILNFEETLKRAEEEETDEGPE